MLCRIKDVDGGGRARRVGINDHWYHSADVRRAEVAVIASATSRRGPRILVMGYRANVFQRLAASIAGAHRLSAG